MTQEEKPEGRLEDKALEMLGEGSLEEKALEMIEEKKVPLYSLLFEPESLKEDGRPFIYENEKFVEIIRKIQKGGIPIDLEKLASLKALLEFYDDVLFRGMPDPDSVYFKAYHYKSTQENLEKFVELIEKYQKEDNFCLTGAFLAGLINQLPGNITLDLRNINEELHFIGSELDNKILTVLGNGGVFLGTAMYSGRIIVKGDVGLGAGQGMKGGDIFIEENAGSSIGMNMTGGRIFILGEYADEWKPDELKFMGATGGEIYHKGKKIFPK